MELISCCVHRCDSTLFVAEMPPLVCKGLFKQTGLEQSVDLAARVQACSAARPQGPQTQRRYFQLGPGVLTLGKLWRPVRECRKRQKGYIGGGITVNSIVGRIRGIHCVSSMRLCVVNERRPPVNAGTFPKVSEILWRPRTLRQSRGGRSVP